MLKAEEFIRGEYPSGLSDLSGEFRVTTTAEFTPKYQL